jgi:hypothetical protein
LPPSAVLCSSERHRFAAATIHKPVALEHKIKCKQRSEQHRITAHRREAYTLTLGRRASWRTASDHSQRMTYQLAHGVHHAMPFTRKFSQRVQIHTKLPLSMVTRATSSQPHSFPMTTRTSCMPA